MGNVVHTFSHLSLLFLAFFSLLLPLFCAIEDGVCYSMSVPGPVPVPLLILTEASYRAAHYYFILMFDPPYVKLWHFLLTTFVS